MIKVLLAIVGIPLAFGVIMGLLSSYRAGQKPLQDLYLICKKFAQQIPFRTIWRHTKEYWPYYGMVIVLFMSAIQE